MLYNKIICVSMTSISHSSKDNTSSTSSKSWAPWVGHPLRGWCVQSHLIVDQQHGIGFIIGLTIDNYWPTTLTNNLKYFKLRGNCCNRDYRTVFYIAQKTLELPPVPPVFSARLSQIVDEAPQPDSHRRGLPGVLGIRWGSTGRWAMVGLYS